MQENTALPTTDKDQADKVTVVAGGRPPRRQISKRTLIWVLGAVVVIVGLIIGGYLLYSAITRSPSPNENTETAIDVSSQLQEADGYPKGSYVWANVMLNAAIYAGSNGACRQADDIIGQVESAQLEEPVDIDAAKSQIGETCG